MQEPSARQRRLLDLLRRSEAELSSQELHRCLLAAGESFGLASVYRALHQLQRLGLVRSRRLANGESVYAPLDRHEHHLTCIACGGSWPLTTCPLGAAGLDRASAALQGFQPLFHTFEIHGLCQPCQARAESGAE